MNENILKSFKLKSTKEARELINVFLKLDPKIIIILAKLPYKTKHHTIDSWFAQFEHFKYDGNNIFIGIKSAHNYMEETYIEYSPSNKEWKITSPVFKKLYIDRWIPSRFVGYSMSFFNKLIKECKSEKIQMLINFV